MLSLRVISCFAIIASIATLSAIVHTKKTTYGKLKSGDVITVSLDQLLPTQAVLSYDREYANLARYNKNQKQMYNDLCKANGAKGIKKWSEDSKPTDPSSYQCKAKSGTLSDALSTVIIGPEDGMLFLTKGHHTLSTFWDMPNGGISVPIMVKVTHNLVGSADDFWAEMNNDHEVWLISAKGKKLDVDDLPQYIGRKQLKNDPYLSLVYFLEGISYSSAKARKNQNKESTPPYFELNWALTLRKYMKISDYDLNVPDEYATALAEAATVMVDMPDDEIIGKSDKTAKEMGKFKTVDSKALEHLITNKKSDFNYALAYRLEKKEKSTPKRLLENEEKDKDKSKKSSNKKAE
ncbi:ParB/Srx family N-terminal domain-containing protein [uncultured Photobacterium sp.]|uniref:ParB/Srx family N-terminal domain-containing protein n=1 Tax=uncultured Photobacterium sp. TaxID=173973 RepID=UPI00260473C0|nr:ParB/Srx family N-terminal domain-containing protein [uncultured Photobacterium sp.]